MIIDKKIRIVAFKVTEGDKEKIEKQANKNWNGSSSDYIRSLIDKDLKEKKVK